MKVSHFSLVIRLILLSLIEKWSAGSKIVVSHHDIAEIETRLFKQINFMPSHLKFLLQFLCFFLWLKIKIFHKNSIFYEQFERIEFLTNLQIKRHSIFISLVSFISKITAIHLSNIKFKGSIK